MTFNGVKVNATEPWLVLTAATGNLASSVLLSNLFIFIYQEPLFCFC